MVYTALTPLILGDRQERLSQDHRSHEAWVAAACAFWWKGEGVELTPQMKADIVTLLDAAADRAAFQRQQSS